MWWIKCGSAKEILNLCISSVDFVVAFILHGFVTSFVWKVIRRIISKCGNILFLIGKKMSDIFCVFILQGFKEKWFYNFVIPSVNSTCHRSV